MHYKAYLFPFFLLLAAFVPGQREIPGLRGKPGTGKIDFVPFKAGESLVYNLHYGFIDAGQASLSIGKEEKMIAGKNHFEITVSGKSYPFFDPFYKVRDKYQSYIDESEILPTIYTRDVSEGSYVKKESYIFVRSKNLVVSGTKKIPVPPDIHDLVSTFYNLRCIDFSKQKPGAVFKMEAIFDEKIMQTGIVYDRKETISTKWGKMKCYVFRPILAKGRIFKNQDDMLLYVSEDKNQIPVRIQSKIYLDYVKADLDKYENLKYPLAALVNKK
jgi:hypothetical protein